MNLYLWVKVFHLFSIIAWMAGLFYLPRILMYNTTVTPQTQAAQVLNTMAQRLFYIIMMPALVLSLATGSILAMIPSIIDWKSGWFHVKLLCVGCLVCFHISLNHWRKLLKAGQPAPSTRFFRIINEVPTLVLLIILICVVIKPF